MWNSIFIVLLTIGGSLALGIFGDCDMSECDGPSSGIMTSMAPTEDQLKEICPPMLERFQCQKNAIKACTGKELEELTSSDNSTVASFSTLLLNLQGVSEDICDEDSILHEGYVSSVGCFNDMMKGPNPKCRVEAGAVYRSYIASQKLLGVVRNPIEESRDADCLITAYAVACFTIEFKEQCGEIAGATMVEVLKRVKFVSLGSGACTKDQVDVLKTTYLDFMEFEEPKKSWFSQVFNSRK